MKKDRGVKKLSIAIAIAITLSIIAFLYLANSQQVPLFSTDIVTGHEVCGQFNDCMNSAERGFILCLDDCRSKADQANAECKETHAEPAYQRALDILFKCVNQHENQFGINNCGIFEYNCELRMYGECITNQQCKDICMGEDSAYEKAFDEYRKKINACNQLRENDLKLCDEKEARCIAEREEKEAACREKYITPEGCPNPPSAQNLPSGLAKILNR